MRTICESYAQFPIHDVETVEESVKLGGLADCSLELVIEEEHLEDAHPELAYRVRAVHEAV